MTFTLDHEDIDMSTPHGDENMIGAPPPHDVVALSAREQEAIAALELAWLRDHPAYAPPGPKPAAPAAPVVIWANRLLVASAILLSVVLVLALILGLSV